MLKLKPTEAR